MPYGLTDIELQKLLDVFAKNERIDQVILYGSRAKGNFKPFSDVDITLVGSELSRDDLNKVIQEIDDLLLPYQFDVSLKHKLKNEALIDHIERRGIEIYKKESIGEWKEYKLGEIATFRTERLSSSIVSIENYISTENMIPNKGGILKANRKPENELVTKYYCGDILVSNIRPYFKKIWLTNKEGGCSNDVLCITPKTNELNNKFLFYLLSQNEFFEYVMLGSKGCKMPRGDKSHIMNYRVILPSQEEQKRIASILGSLDDKIDLLQKENKTLEAMAETLFRKWFIEEVRQEVLLGDVVETTSGGTPSRKYEKYYQNGTIDWVKSKELNRSFLLKTEENITLEAVENSSAKFIPANSVLIAMYGATVGEYAIIAKEMTCNQAVCALKPNDNYPYTYLYLWAKFMQDEFLNLACGAAQQNISQVLIKQQQICSDVDVVKQFHYIVEPFFEKIKQNEMQLSSLEEMKNLILPKLMNNE